MALTSLVLRWLKVASLDVTSLLEGIDLSTLASIRSRFVLVFSLVTLPPLAVVLLPSYPLASAITTCCQVLAMNGFLCRSLDHLSVLPHHMLGCGNLDLHSRSPPGVLAILPFEASFTQMALVGIGWSSDALLGDATHGCRLLALTQCLATPWLPSVGFHSIPYSRMWFGALRSMSLVVAQVN